MGSREILLLLSVLFATTTHALTSPRKRQFGPPPTFAPTAAPAPATTTQALTTPTPLTPAPSTGPWGICSLVLDPHGNSTDGAEFKVTDVCTYDLALYDASLNVAMETYRRNNIDERRGVSFVKLLMIQHNGVAYSMYPNALYVDNVEVNSDANFDCNSGMYKFCCVSRKTQFKVCSDRKFSFYLHFGSFFNNTLSGLCGNFNGDPSDDYVLRGGGAANATEDFVQSWERPNCQ